MRLKIEKLSGDKFKCKILTKRKQDDGQEVEKTCDYSIIIIIIIIIIIKKCLVPAAYNKVNKPDRPGICIIVLIV